MDLTKIDVLLPFGRSIGLLSSGSGSQFRREGYGLLDLGRSAFTSKKDAQGPGLLQHCLPYILTDLRNCEVLKSSRKRFFSEISAPNSVQI